MIIVIGHIVVMTEYGTYCGDDDASDDCWEDCFDAFALVLDRKLYREQPDIVSFEVYSFHSIHSITVLQCHNDYYSDFTWYLMINAENQNSSSDTLLLINSAYAKM